jgi:hypothetical protein
MHDRSAAPEPHAAFFRRSTLLPAAALALAVFVVATVVHRPLALPALGFLAFGPPALYLAGRAASGDRLVRGPLLPAFVAALLFIVVGSAAPAAFRIGMALIPIGIVAVFVLARQERIARDV